VRLPLLAWIGLAVLGLALSVALLPRGNKVNTTVVDMGASPTAGTLAAAVASAGAPTDFPGTQPSRQNPLRAGGCLLWSEVGQAQVGQVVCVFGIVSSNVPRSGSTPTVIQFSATPTDFKLQDFSRSYPDLVPGTCLVVRGRVVEVSGSLSIAPGSALNAVALYPIPADCG
jgi:hypothetical protein